MTELGANSDVLTRGDGISVWRRIADWIRTEIAAGRLVVDERLPSEAELARKFDVNRHTVRRALAALAEEGVVRSAQGRGTFIEQGRINYPIGARTRFTENLAAEGHVATGELIDARKIEADERIARLLQVDAGAAVSLVHILRLSDGVPLSSSTNYFPLPRFAGFAEAFRTMRAVTPALAACGVTDYRRLQTRVSARRATDLETVTLEIELGGIVLVTESVNVDGEGVPIQVTEAHFPADRIELSIDSEIKAPSGR